MIRRTPLIWAVIAGIFTFVYWLAGLNNPFSFEYFAWESSHMALLAHNFAALGVLHLHGVPIENYLPLGLQPDRYVHWPPLYPVLLSVFYNLFGESQAVFHIFVILVNLFYFAALYLLLNRCFDREVALWTLFVLMTMGSFTNYSRMAWTPNAVMGALSLALYFYLRGTEDQLKWKWVAAGAVSLAFAVAFGWEAAPLGFILFLAERWNRSQPRRSAAVLYGVTGMTVVAAITALYITASSELGNDLWQTIRAYMGSVPKSSEVPIHEWTLHAGPPLHIGLLNWILVMGNNWILLLGGTLGLLATGGVLVSVWLNRKVLPQPYFVLAALFGIPLIWNVIFPVHVYLHEYQTLIALPVVSISLALCIKFASDKLPAKLKVVAVVILPILLIVPLIERARIAFVPLRADPDIQYAQDIEANTPEASIVLSSEVSMVPVYYSHRHFIRGIVNDETLSKAFPEAETVFPGSDIYLAVPLDKIKSFPCASYRLPLVNQTRTMVLFKAVPGDCR